MLCMAMEKSCVQFINIKEEKMTSYILQSELVDIGRLKDYVICQQTLNIYILNSFCQKVKRDIPTSNDDELA